LHRYQPQRALDLFSSWIGVSSTDSVGTLTAKAVVAEQQGNDLSAQAPRAPSQNPFSWSAVVDVLAGDDAASTLPPVLAPRGRHPLGAPRADDEVKALPGWDGVLPSEHYSGYLDVPVETGGPKDIHIHYWLTESEGNPDTDPVVFWMNGGPGVCLR